MLTPCRPCSCPGAPCEQCVFGYQSKETNHEQMRSILVDYLNGNRKGYWRVAERYMENHPNWREELGEYEKEEFTMISAADARKKADESIDILVMREIKAVEANVISACEEGKTTITCTGTLSEKTVNKLQELGYEVVRSSQYNESYYTISWTGDWREE